MISVTIRIPDFRSADHLSGPLPASVQADGYHVEARYTAWGRNRDGSISVDVSASLRSPAGLMAVLR